MVVDSEDGIILSLDMDRVFVEGYMMINKVDGLVCCKLIPGYF